MSEQVTVLGIEIDILCSCGKEIGIYTDNPAGFVEGKCNYCGQTVKGSAVVVLLYGEKEEVPA